MHLLSDGFLNMFAVFPVELCVVLKEINEIIVVFFVFCRNVALKNCNNETTGRKFEKEYYVSNRNKTSLNLGI